MFGLCVRFTCKDEASAEAYDRLVADTIEAIKANEPGTLVYASHLVEGQPLQRIFYELYRDKAAFDAHEAAAHTCRYLDARDQFLASTEVDWLTLQAGKGTDG
jgi:quinol monooxygenase YgiN